MEVIIKYMTSCALCHFPFSKLRQPPAIISNSDMHFIGPEGREYSPTDGQHFPRMPVRTHGFCLNTLHFSRAALVDPGRTEVFRQNPCLIPS
jgi:hypothetical protein